MVNYHDGGYKYTDTEANSTGSEVVFPQSLILCLHFLYILYRLVVPLTFRYIKQKLTFLKILISFTTLQNIYLIMHPGSDLQITFTKLKPS